MFKSVVAGVAGLCVAGAALGQEQAAPVQAPAPEVATDTAPAQTEIEGRDPNQWRWDIEPAAWFVGISGRLRLPRETPGTAGRVTLRELNMDNPQFAPLVEVNARRGDWRGTFRGIFFGMDRDASGLDGSVGDVDFSAGDTLNSSLDFTVMELEAAYTFAGKPQERQSDGTWALDPRLDAVGGVRVYGESWEIQNLSGGTDSHDDWFIQPHVGLKLNTDIYERFTMDAQITLGGLPTSENDYSFDIIVGGQWRPWDNVGVQIGYRALFFGLGDGEGADEFSFDGSLQGLYAGLVIRF